MDSLRRLPGTVWAAVSLVPYGWLLIRLYGRMGETFDGFIGIMNAALMGGVSIPGNYLKLAKAPLGSLALAPFAAAAYARGGPEACLLAAHIFQILCACGFVLLSWRFFRTLYGRPVAALLALLLALNPVLLRNAAFSNFDVSGGLAALFFIMSALAHCEKPTRGSYLRLLASGAAAFLVKYHQGIFILLPPLLAFSRRFDRRQKLGLILAPALTGALCLAVFVFCSAVWMRESPFSLRAALDLAFRANVTGREASLVYFREMLYQLGPATALLAATGFVLWCARGDAKARALAAGAALPILILSTAIKTSESRYTLFFVPLVYAAAGAALEAWTGTLKESARWALAAVLLFLSPLSVSYAAVERLVDDPNFATRLPYILARYAESREGPEGCMAWVAGEIRYPVPPSPSPMMDNWTSVLMSSNLQFFTKVRLEEVSDADAARGLSCRPGLILLPKYAANGRPGEGRWETPELGRLYHGSAMVKIHEFSLSP